MVVPNIGITMRMYGFPKMCIEKQPFNNIISNQMLITWPTSKNFKNQLPVTAVDLAPKLLGIYTAFKN